MAKYTMLLSDYLKSEYSLPDLFNEIEGFTDLFISKYFDREIGFETPNLFSLKLQAKAKLVIPFYKERINLLTEKFLGVANPTKVRYETNEIVFNKDKVKSTSTELPNTARYSSVEPSSVSEIDSYTDTTNNTNNKNESGFTPDELRRIIDMLNHDLTNMTEKLLLEFNSCFMVIY